MDITPGRGLSVSEFSTSSGSRLENPSVDWTSNFHPYLFDALPPESLYERFHRGSSEKADAGISVMGILRAECRDLEVMYYEVVEFPLCRSALFPAPGRLKRQYLNAQQGVKMCVSHEVSGRVRFSSGWHGRRGLAARSRQFRPSPSHRRSASAYDAKNW